MEKFRSFDNDDDDDDRMGNVPNGIKHNVHFDWPISISKNFPRVKNVKIFKF